MQNSAGIIVLVSGEGTNLQAILDASSNGVLCGANVIHVFSNKPNVGAIDRAHRAGIETTTVTWNRNAETREYYDQRLAALILKKQFRFGKKCLIVLAGWMHILSTAFLEFFSSEQVINLHPALPGKFPGAHAIEDAMLAGVEKSGCMVHTVVPDVDAGRVIEVTEVPVSRRDTVETLRQRIQFVEKSCLILGIIKQMRVLEKEPNHITLISTGKVRNVYDIDLGAVLLMDATNRLSSFDQNLCEIPQKGCIINRLSAWWFQKTRHIVPNHLLHTDPDSGISFVRKCKVFPIEFVVRGYITGSTNTSMWTLYGEISSHSLYHH